MVFVCFKGYWFRIFLWFCYCILELFRQWYVLLCFSCYCTKCMENVKIRLQVTTIFKIYILSVFCFFNSKPNYTAKYYLSFCCFFIRCLFNVYFLYQLHLNIIFMFHSLYFTFVIPGMLQCITSLCKIAALNCILCNFHFRIYPIGLEIKKTTYTAMSPSYLDLEIDSEAQLRTKLYNKRDDFDVNFPNVNFPFMCSNIPAVPAYGVYISELIRYCRACGSHHELLDRWVLLTMEYCYVPFIALTIRSFLHSCLITGFVTSVIPLSYFTFVVHNPSHFPKLLFCTVPCNCFFFHCIVL